MFLCGFTKAHTFKQLIDSVKDLIDVCNIECNAAGMRLQAMDSSMICLVDMFVASQSQMVSDYICERPVCMGLNMGLLSGVLALAHADGPVVLKYESDHLTVIFEDPYTEIDVPLIDLRMDTPEIPDDVEGGLTITLPSSQLSKVITTESQLADQLILEASGNTAKFIIDNNLGSGGVSWQMQSSIAQPTRILLSLKHMSLFMKASGLTKKVKLWIGEPVIIDYTLDGLGHIKFYLASQTE